MKTAAPLLFCALLLPLGGGCNLPTTVSPPLDNGLAPFDGHWDVVEIHEQGKEVDQKAHKIKIWVVINNGSYQRYEGRFTQAEADRAGEKHENKAASIRVDNMKTPREIDFVLMGGDLTGKMLLGIYALEGEDQLKICVAAMGEPRPTDFVPGEKNTLMVMKKRKAEVLPQTQVTAP